jgi:hypothetical protein
MKTIFSTSIFCLILSSGAQVQAQNTFPTTGNVGIGTLTPIGSLDVVRGNALAGTALFRGTVHISHFNYSTTEETYIRGGKTGSAVLINDTHNGPVSIANGGGNVGIGTLTPIGTLDVVRGNGVNGTALFRGTVHISHFNYSTTEETYIRGGKTGSAVLINDTHNGNVSIANGGGNVGIGTTDTKGYKLGVNGSAIATSMTVKLNANWPDFVFAKTYGLRPLAEVESYIKAHSHLPEVPSAAQVAKEGINLGEMDATLLKKIEELTLYLIEQNKKIEALEKQLSEDKK